MSNKSKRKGYRNEVAVAKYYGGERKGTLGYEDVAHSLISIETKVHAIPAKIVKLIPYVYGGYLTMREEEVGKFVFKSYQQAVSNAPQSKIPVFHIHEDNARRDDDVVVLLSKHFEELTGRVLPSPPSEKYVVMRAITFKHVLTDAMKGGV